MFREMRRKNQQLTPEETQNILMRGNSGVLAVHGDDGYPYAVPISYVYHGNNIYFHSALSGHKLDAINSDAKVSFCVIAQDQIVPEQFTTYFRSAIAFGNARVIQETSEKRKILKLLGMKYSANFPDKMDEEINGAIGRTAIIVLEIEHMSGKEAVELTKQKKD